MMKIVKPVLGEQLDDLEDVASFAGKSRLEETAIVYRRIKGACVSEADLSGLNFEHVLFEHCRLINCSFEKSSFTDTVFKSCDLSNSVFQGSYFNRCELIAAKAVGTNFGDSCMTNVGIDQSNFKYANFNAVRFEKIAISHSDFSDAFVTGCRLKGVLFNALQLVKTSFFDTPLRGIDFTSSRMEGIVVSAKGAELQGAVVNLRQAADLAKLLGVVIR